MSTVTDATTVASDKFWRLNVSAANAHRWVQDHSAELGPDAYVYPLVGIEGTVEVSIMCETPEALARATRVLVGQTGKVEKGASETAMEVRTETDTIKFRAWASREQVCELVEVGIETVEIPDPDAPMVTVTRPVTEWKCAPILAADVFDDVPEVSERQALALTGEPF